jgi:hypothetical protein
MPFFERVLAINPPDPVLRGDTYLGMARALDAKKKGSPQALASARKARAEFASAKVPEAVAEVDTWLAQRSGAKAKSRGR